MIRSTGRDYKFQAMSVNVLLMNKCLRREVLESDFFATVNVPLFCSATG